jgi:hypothetical protein
MKKREKETKAVKTGLSLKLLFIGQDIPLLAAKDNSNSILGNSLGSTAKKWSFRCFPINDMVFFS